MGFAYKIIDGYAHFLTLTIVDWVDLFTRTNHKHVITDSLKYCQENKGLGLYAWCLMPSHLHMIAAAAGNKNLSDILRDFKRYTSLKLIKTIKEEPESRRKWLLNKFEFAGRYNPKKKYYKVWTDGYHPEFLYTPEFTKQKIDYIHNNPVKAQIVEKPEDYLFSSARNYAGLDGILDVIVANTGVDRAC